jgi:Tol biopolymer transport system component
MRERVLEELARISRQHNVRILLAVESGSRARGFASSDSDYDVRFVYAHKPDWYLSIFEGRDVIELLGFYQFFSFRDRGLPGMWNGASIMTRWKSFWSMFELAILSEFASFAASRHNAPQVSYVSPLIFTMSVDVGTRLGSLEITALLGKGGMGEVYRARDTKLKREVAIKILPDEFSRDTDRVARFQREAEVLASLNHPNIAAIYDLEEANNATFLVLELVEGETLADRIARGPIPVNGALNIAKAICEALEAAHEKGIVHRDLKPANVKITPDGKVKVLDFGLAKALENVQAASSLSNSPTIGVMNTNAGVILGTASYMSPEQARGKAVDKRTDVWSFGAVLYEMLTGEQLFQGETISDIVAAVLSKEPNWQRVPAKVQRLLKSCLEKDPKRRLYAISDWRLLLEDAAETAPLPKTWAPWTVAALLAIVAALSLWELWRRPAPTTSQAAMRLDLDLDAPIALANIGPDAILSPDGTRLVVVAQGSKGKSRLLTRRLDESQLAELRGSEGAYAPFFSPDGQWVAFFAGGKLRKLPIDGGEPVILCDAPAGRGGSWSDDGNIIASLDTQVGLSVVPSAGGKPAPLTTLAPGENSHRWPQVLRAGKVVLFSSNTTYANYAEASIIALSLTNHTSKIILKSAGMFPRYVPSGYLLYVSKGTLFAMAFDPGSLESRGRAVPLVEDVSNDTRYGFARLDFSGNGTLLYRKGRTVGLSTLHWMNRTGRTEPLEMEPALYLFPRISPDGSKLIWMVNQGPSADLWIYDWQRGSKTRLTDGKDVYSNPVWSPDGRYVIFISSAGIRWTRADGAGRPQPLTASKALQFPNSFTPDGRRLVFTELISDGALIRTVTVDGSSGQLRASTPELFLQTPSANPFPAFSPDGRWLAYADAESGTYEVYVRSFPDKGTRWLISNGGGMMPVWSKSGRELYYRTEDNRIMASTFSGRGDTFVAEKPHLWSEKQLENTGTTPNYDLAPDGKRFAVLLPAEGPEPTTVRSHVTLVMNFFEELRRRAPLDSR